jgi:hypothetical protein
MNPDKPVNKSPATPTDCVLEWMKENNVPPTKENYLHIAYMGQEIPLGAEQEIPRELMYRQDRQETDEQK